MTSASAATGPTTPRGTAVSYATYTCSHSSGYHEKVAEADVSAYGVSLIAVGSCVFNCHSYAWYSQSTSNPYWIPDPSIYMTDGSYTKYFSGTASSSAIDLQLGDRLYYTGLHSAIVTSSASGAPLGIQQNLFSFYIQPFFHKTILRFWFLNAQLLK